MNPKRLEYIRKANKRWVGDMVDDLLEYVDELTRQRDDARRIAMDSGVFQNIGGTSYLPDVHLNEEDKWRADPVGPVAWDRQEQQ
jgi:hypothetical protein